MAKKNKFVIEALGLLGMRAKDKVTGYEGVITSTCFDLYGCVQVSLTPASDGDKELKHGHWFDIQRVQITSDERVMAVPEYEGRLESPSAYKHGPADKPAKTGMPTV